MSSIGPQIPAHLLSKLRNGSDGNDDDEEEETGPVPVAGPQIPLEVLNKPKPEVIADEDDDDDDYAPALPPDLAASRSAGPSVTAPSRIGPALPSAGGMLHDDDDSDDDVGPMPLPPGVHYEEPDAVAQFMQKEENRRREAAEAAKPKALKRDEWMLVPPSSSDLLANIDPTKLTKGRQFARTAAPAREVDNSLWTETPAERQQRLADEVSGKKRRAANADSTLSPEEELELRKKRRRDESIRKGVEEHTRKVRGEVLVDQHSKSQKPEDPASTAIWDHSRDMSLGGRLMDDSTRAKMLRDAKGLGDRFGTGTGGGFL